MATVDEQIVAVDGAITSNIASLSDRRDLLSVNMMSQLRNLVEAVAVRLHLQDGNREFQYDELVKPALKFLGSANRDINFLLKFHRFVQISASHYTFDGETSERLMLKYFSYLVQIRDLLEERYGMQVLANLDSFPIDLDPSLTEYHQKIADQIEASRRGPAPTVVGKRYYIHKTVPFLVRGRIYYEVSFFPANNKATKSDRVSGFTTIDVDDKYSATLTLEESTIDVLGTTMPITMIWDWHVSIRPCEFDNFARLVGITSNVRAGTPEYNYVMENLTASGGSLLDLMHMSDRRYQATRAEAVARVQRPQIFPALDKAREIVRGRQPGQNLLRYLLLLMNNHILKPQWASQPCRAMSALKVSWSCIPFDEMPFCTSPVGHNPRFWDLVESISTNGRHHELLARRAKSNVESHGMLYTPVQDLDGLGDVTALIDDYNQRLYYKHRPTRDLVLSHDHVFIQQYEDNTVAIIEQIQQLASSGVDGYSPAIEQWLTETSYWIDDAGKLAAMKTLFAFSRVALIYGAAGTGKSTMVNHVANYFSDKQKLFLAHTNAAVENLRTKVTAQQNSVFRTITAHGYEENDPEWDLVVIDECSILDNGSLLKVLQNTRFKLLILVGDVFQIESIKFGNWFDAIRKFVPKQTIVELTQPYRTTSASLLGFWNKLRRLDDDVAETIAHYGYSTALSETLFDNRGADEIILCLNYDGLYGINNVNRFLQARNPSPAVSWGAATYKIGDPILFGDSGRFGRAIHRNMKAVITNITVKDGSISFAVKPDRILTELDCDGVNLVWLGNGVVQFEVVDRDISDEDDDSTNSIVPFQIAYAVSIHKAQGLEYSSVKIVITDSNEDDITHSILYTAVTRARQHLVIYWSAETQQAVLSNLKVRSAAKDVALLMARRGLRRLTA
jgi:hypothetical protein